MAFSPSPMPSSLPIATRTAGAICAVTFTPGSSSAAQTAAVSLFTTMAPVGQTAAHWPQPTQGDSDIGVSKAVEMVILAPRWAKSMAPTFCTSLHMRTQSPQRMHLF